MNRVLMTGITGLVGSSFATNILQKRKDIYIIALARSNKSLNAEERVKQTIEEQYKLDGSPELISDALERIEVIEHDTVNPLQENILKNLPQINSIFHCAADVNLAKDPHKKTFYCNYNSTKNLIDAAKSLNAKEFHLVSTAYVAGRTVGRVMEDSLIKEPVFNNSYEESKYKAEELVRNSGIPFTIYRPSIITGRLDNGKIRKPLAFYRILDFMAKTKKQQNAKHNRAPNAPITLPIRLRAKMSNYVYFVPIDFVQKAITNIFQLPPNNKTYHITGNGPANVHNIRDVVCSLLNIGGLQIQETINKLTPFDRLVNKYLGDLLPYVSSEVIFDISNVTEVMEERDLNWQIDYETLYFIIGQYYRSVYPEVL